MWTSTIASKKRENDKHNVLVVFTDGIEKFAMNFLVKNKFQLDAGIQQKLDDLNQDDLASVIEGPYVPAPQMNQLDPLDVKLMELRKLKELTDLEVLPKGSAEYTTALDAVKDEIQK